MILNYKFLQLDREIGLLIKQPPKLFNNAYYLFCLGKYYQSVNDSTLSLHFFKKALELEVRNTGLLFNKKREKDCPETMLTGANKISYEFFRISSEIKTLTPEPFIPVRKIFSHR